MAKIIRAEFLGFCPGVESAVDRLEEALGVGGPVATVGSIVHNPQLVQRLREQGADVIEPEASVPKGMIFGRTHGLAVGTQKRFAQNTDLFVDVTCPRVARIHRIAERVDPDTAMLVVVGNPGHPEVAGIVSRCANTVVVTREEDLAAVVTDLDVILVGQTTVQRELFEGIVDILRKRRPAIVVHDTLCGEIDRRVAAARQLAREVDAVVVVGGTGSSNTRRIETAVSDCGVPCFRVETAAELPPGIGSFETVGITAGASTPGWIINEVEAAIGAKQEHE